MKRLYEAIENGVVDMADPSLKDRIAELSAVRDQAQATLALPRLRPLPRASCVDVSGIIIDRGGTSRCPILYESDIGPPFSRSEDLINSVVDMSRREFVVAEQNEIVEPRVDLHRAA